MTKKQMAGRMVAVAVVTGSLAAAHLKANNRPVNRAIEGVWEPTVTIRDCQTQAPIFSFASMDSYIRGGSLVAESASEPNVRATGLGSWQHVGGRNFTALYQFFTYDPTGLPSGRLKVSARIRLGADGSSFTTSDTAEVTDLQGNVLGHVCGTREARRLQ